MTCGIYMLQFKGTDKVYIGQSINIEKRYKEHLTRPKTGRKLQEAFNTYGNPTLLILLDDLTPDELNDAENESIEIFNSVDNGFNQLYLAGSFPDNSGTANGMSKYSKEEIVEAFNLLLDNPNKTCLEISQLCGVAKGTIESINNGARHRWLKEQFPIEYAKLISLRNLRSTNSIGNNHKRTINTFISPEGVIYKDIKNISEFARTQGFSESRGFRRLAQGIQKVYKGWTISQ